MSKLSDISSDSDLYIISSDDDSTFLDESVIKWANTTNSVLKDHYRMLFLNEQVEKLALQALKEAETALTKIRQKMKNIDDEPQRTQNLNPEVKKKKRRLAKFALPYFKINGFYPPMNSDTIKWIKYKAHSHPSFKKPWAPAELRNLQKNVKDNAVKLSIRPLEARISFLSEKYLSDDERKSSSEICKLKRKINAIRRNPWVQLAKNKGKFDWLKISADMKQFHDPDECQRMWECFQSPDINKKGFTKEEDEKLKKIAKEHGAQNWDDIAKKLRTNRSPFQCFQRYQTRLVDRDTEKKFFSEKEDELLVKIVEEVRMGNFINWYKVAHLLGTQKSHRQCAERYNNALRPNVKKGQWFTEDDAMMLLSRAVIGSKWRTICTFIGRPYYVCIRRYNFLKPLITAKERKEARKGKEFSDQDTDSCESQSDASPEPYKAKPYQWFASYSQLHLIDEAFAFAKYGIEKACGKEIDISSCKKFEDFADIVKFTDLKHIAKVLYSEGKELRKNSFMPQMRPVCLDSQELQDLPFCDSNNEENFTNAYVEKQLKEVLKPLMPTYHYFYYSGKNRFKKVKGLVTCLSKVFDVEDKNYVRNRQVERHLNCIEDFIMPCLKIPLFPPNLCNMSAAMSFLSVLPPSSTCDSVEKSTDADPTISLEKKYLKSFHNYSSIEENEAQNENESCFPALGNISRSKKVNRQWELFRKRIIATFQWPILLSQLPPSNEQVRLLANDLEEKHVKLKKSKKRKYESSTDEEY